MRNNRAGALAGMLCFIMMVWAGSAAAQQNMSYRFNGTSYINITNGGWSSPFNFTTDTFTIEAWIRPSGITTGSTPYDYTIAGNDSNINNIGLGYTFSVGSNRVLSFAYAHGSGIRQTNTTLASIDTNQWQHVAVTKSGGTVKLYLNGHMVSSSTNTIVPNIAMSGKTLKIGANGEGTRNFRGMIDEVKIWKGERTDTEIKMDMKEICGGYPAALLAYYKLDNFSNPILCANNSTFNGTISGAADSWSGATLYDGRSTVLYVDSTNWSTLCGANDGYTWATAFGDLNAAIEVAQINPQIEKILVAKGTYNSYRDRYYMQPSGRSTEQPANGSTFHLRPGVEMYGGYPIGGGSVANPALHPTILDGRGMSNNTVIMDTSVYFYTAADTTKLVGFTVIRGNRGIFCDKGLHAIEKCKVSDMGPGIYIDKATVVMTEDTLTDSRIEARSSHITIRNSRVKKCLFNPAVWAVQSYFNMTGSEVAEVSDGAITLDNCTALVTNNHIHHNSRGGIRTDNTKTTHIANNRIVNNRHHYPGGGIMLNGGNNEVLNNIIMFDTSDASGSGMYGTGNNVIAGNVISNNYTIGHISGLFVQFGRNMIYKNFISANTAAGAMGGVFVQATDSPVVIANNVIANNMSDAIGGMGLEDVSKVICVNNTFYNNNTVRTDSLFVAGGLRLMNAKAEVSNNIFWKNKVGGDDTLKGADIRTNGTNTFKYNSLQRKATAYTSSATGNYNLGTNAIGNYFGKDPQFVNTAALQGPDGVYGSIDDGLQLTYGSPVVDSGKSTLIPLSITDDITGRARVYDYDVDLGAYELSCLPADVTAAAQKNICYGNGTTLRVNAYASFENVKWYADSTGNTLLDTGYYYHVPALTASDTFWVTATGCANGQRVPIRVRVYDHTPSVLNVSRCDSFFWNLTGVYYKTGGIYADTLTNVWGCDSVVHLNLTLGYTNIPAPATITACKSYTWVANNKKYTESGTYTDTLTNTGGCDSIVTLNLTIPDTVYINQTGYFLEANTGASSYQWVKCNPYQVIPNATADTYIVTQNGNYAVIATFNGCTDTSSCVNINTINVDDPALGNLIAIKPNPTTGIAVITLPKAIDNATLTVTNAIGETILNMEVKPGKQLGINLSNYPAGVYMLDIRNDEVRYTTKLVKQ